MTKSVFQRCGASPASLYLAVADYGNGKLENRVFPNIHQAQGWADEFADHATRYGVRCVVDVFALIRTNHVESRRLPFIDMAEEREEVCCGR